MHHLELNNWCFRARMSYGESQNHRWWRGDFWIFKAKGFQRKRGIEMKEVLLMRVLTHRFLKLGWLCLKCKHDSFSLCSLCSCSLLSEPSTTRSRERGAGRLQLKPFKFRIENLGPGCLARKDDNHGTWGPSPAVAGLPPPSLCIAWAHATRRANRQTIYV